MASSPDEKALLEECRAAGFDFLGAALDGTMRVRIGGNGESGEQQGCNSIHFFVLEPFWSFETSSPSILLCC